MKTKKILLVEDDIPTLKLVQFVLEEHNFTVLTAEAGHSTYEILENQRIDGAVLDLYLPDTNGMDILKRIRNHKIHHWIPVIILTGNSDKLEAILALEMGADDYITKPFHKRELIARLNANIRRTEGLVKPYSNFIVSGDLKIDMESRMVFKDNKELSLTYAEFEIFSMLCSNPGKVFSRDSILTKLWGVEYIGETRIVDMHVSSLRKKIGDNKGSIIETIRGVGYRFRK